MNLFVVPLGVSMFKFNSLLTSLVCVGAFAFSASAAAQGRLTLYCSSDEAWCQQAKTEFEKHYHNIDYSKNPTIKTKYTNIIKAVEALHVELGKHSQVNKL